MVRENAGAITFGILTPLWPAGMIAFLTVGVNLIVDWFLRRTSELREEY
jgi:peptide/nickel transport system permease protein